MSGIRRILVPIDFSPAAEQALAYAVALAKRFEAKLELLHAFQAPLLEFTPYHFAMPEVIWDDLRDAARARLEERREKASAEGVEVAAHLTRGIPAEAISDAAGRLGADLIVMATHGHSGLAHVLLGSVAERTLRAAPCPVLTLRPARD